MAISTFMGLETNKRGLTAQQTALYTVGHNISNANTVGYTRQRVNLEATHGFPGVGMNAPMLAGHLGTGVTSQSITRVRNEFVDKQYRQETNNLGYWSQRTDAISQMEDIMAEPSAYGLNAAYDEFYTAWQNLANTPSSSAARQVVYTKASHLASSFNYMNKQMTQVQQNLKAESLNAVENVNSILEQISALNNQIKQVEPNGYIPNDIYDARDLLLDELSNYMPITTERTYSGGLAGSDAEGALNVYFVEADGSKTMLVGAEKSGTQQNGTDLYGKSFASKVQLMTGQTLDPNNAGEVIGGTAVTNGDSFTAFSGLQISRTSSTAATEGTVTTDPTTGAITLSNGTVSMVVTKDNTGNYQIEPTSTYPAGAFPLIQNPSGIITFTDPTTNQETTITPKIDNGTITGVSFASSTSTSDGITFNTMAMDKGSLVSYANSYGYTSQQSNTAPVKTKGLYYEKLTDLDTLAREFAKEFNASHEKGYGLSSDGVKDSPTNLKFFDVILNADGSTPPDITASNIKINDEMANFNNIAASSRNKEEGNGDLALNLSNLKTKTISTLGDTSASKFYESMVADVGTEGEKARKMEYNSGTIQLTISNNRDSISSVSLDEEMTNMIMFQQAYNASARMMTAIDEILDKVINGMGRVGL